MIEFIVKYILDEGLMNKIFLISAIVFPLIGLVVGILLDKFKAAGFKNTIWGISIGLTGTLNFILWKLYNRFTDYFGLTTVKNLLFNLLFFIIIGIILGIGFSLLYRFLQKDKLNETR